MSFLIKHPEIRLPVVMAGGASIEKSCEQAIELARKLDVIVDFSFNGIACSAYPTEYSNTEYFVKNWREALKSKEEWRSKGIETFHTAMSYDNSIK